MCVTHSTGYPCYDESIVSYPDPQSHSCGWITSPLRSGDVIHPQLWDSGSGYETNESRERALAQTDKDLHNVAK